MLVLHTTLHSLPLEKAPPAGRTRLCLPNWSLITQDPWVLETVVGYRLELEARPWQKVSPKSGLIPQEQLREVKKEVESMLAKKAIREVTPIQGQFLSRIFTVPKKDGSSRPIINLRPLNRFMAKHHFKMENVAMLKDLLKKGDWMGSIDLKDAFQTVPVHGDFCKLLRFRWEGKMYEYQCLPFGLTSAPRTFTKVMKPIMALLREKGVRCLIFIDDILILATARQELILILQEVITLLRLLGFTINMEKSELTPTQRIQYLGFRIDSRAMTLSLPDNKVKKLLQECKRALSVQMTVRSIARLIGRMSAATQAILPAPLYYRALQRIKNAGFKVEQSFETRVTLDAEARSELRWWIESMSRWNGRTLIQPQPDVTIESDASLLGWGASSDGLETGGLWSQLERGMHINVLELKAGAFAVKTFTKGRQGIHVRLRMDNTTAVAYVNHMGGTRSAQLTNQAKELWQECLSNNIQLSAEHIPGAKNTTADYQSRLLQTSAEWKLHTRVFSKVLESLGECKVDLFATRLNTQLEKYISWKPDPSAIASDALKVPWKHLGGYAFPPFCLVGRCLSKVRSERAVIVLIAPVWPGQPWYPMLLESAIEPPILLPQMQDLLSDPFGDAHPLVGAGKLRLAAWKVSGIASEQQAFRRRLHSSYQRHGAREQIQPTSTHGPNGSAGVCQGAWIPMRAMSNSLSIS